MKFEEKKRCFEFLEKEGYLEYGNVIPKSVFEKLFRSDFNEGWDYLGPFLSIKEYIEENGFLCTSEDQKPGDLKLFDADQIAIRSSMIFKNLINKMKKLQTCLVNTKTLDFDREEIKRHFYETNKITIGLSSLTSSLAKI